MPIDFPRYPTRLAEVDFYPIAYRYMYGARSLDRINAELFKKGQVKGTVIIASGGEATSAGMAMPFRPGKDVVSFLHRDLASHMLFGTTPYTALCQHMANAESPTLGREGNVHYGDAANRRFPMISHLGSMLALVVGGTWSARSKGDDAFGIAVIGDGGTSTGDFHESLNLASVRNVPVLFLVQNNKYAFSTPTRLQYNCAHLSDRARGYGISGRTVDGTDAWQVYNAVYEAMAHMEDTSGPYLLECECLRLKGHAAYDKADYIDPAELAEWVKDEPLPKARQKLAEVSGYSEQQILDLENEIDEEGQAALRRALGVARPDCATVGWDVYAKAETKPVAPFSAKNLKMGAAVNEALDYVLEHDSRAFLIGQDIGTYGSAFKTCKGLSEKYGIDRVIDSPICESATVGFCLGASQTGTRPIMEFQFADFGTEAVTQLGLNAGTWFYRAHNPAPFMVRLPCGGGITLGAFHSGEFDGLWTRFPGLKLLYPATAQEMFEALVASHYDDNPCLILEHKLLYWTKGGDISFDGNLEAVWRPRKYTDGDDLTIVALGASVDAALQAISDLKVSAEVWNPFILNPLSLDEIAASVEKTGNLLVMQESGETAGLGDGIVGRLTRRCFASLKRPPKLVSSPDTPVPFARELESEYLPSKDKIRKAILSMIGGE